MLVKFAKKLLLVSAEHRIHHDFGVDILRRMLGVGHI